MLGRVIVPPLDPRDLFLVDRGHIGRVGVLHEAIGDAFSPCRRCYGSC
jgi:hypothetical protein